MQQQIDRSATIDTAARFTPAQYALLRTARRLLIALLQTLDQLLATE